MYLNLSCDSVLAQTLSSESWPSPLSALSVSHTPQVSAIITIHSAVEEQSIIFRLDCSNWNFKNSEQFNYIVENLKKITKHYDNINYVLYDFGKVWTDKLGKIKNVVPWAAFTVECSLSSETHLLTYPNIIRNSWHLACKECFWQVW